MTTEDTKSLGCWRDTCAESVRLLCFQIGKSAQCLPKRSKIRYQLAIKLGCGFALGLVFSLFGGLLLFKHIALFFLLFKEFLKQYPSIQFGS